MAQYYTRRKIDGVYGDLNGPFESYDDAMDDHTKVCSRLPSNEWPGHMQTFVDLATVVGDQDEMGQLLRSDPVLRAVFELGVSVGRSDSQLFELM